MRIILSTFILIIISLSACNSPCNNVEHVQNIKELQIKLNATEAQLLNVRAELSKCKGDSIPVLP